MARPRGTQKGEKNRLNRRRRNPDITEGSKATDFISTWKMWGVQQQKKAKDNKKGEGEGAKREQKKIKLGRMKSEANVEKEEGWG